MWGVAYKIPHERREHVKTHLDHREKEGYTPVNATFHPKDKNTQSFTIMLYIATVDNPHYFPSENEEIALTIANSVGPSGKNTEYVFNLAEYIRKHIPEDDDSHLFDIERLVKNVLIDNL